MKIKILIVSIILVVTISSCKKVNDKPMLVVRDCTGSYLRFNSNDYLVCNPGSIAAFSSRQVVKASFRKIKTCPDSILNIFRCAMTHPCKGYIVVTKIE